MKKQLAVLAIISAIALSGCAGNSDSAFNSSNNGQSGHSSGADHSGMNHSGSGEVPEGLQEAANPKFKVGSEATIAADHMEGMNGAKATIAGAYSTIVYTVSYTPTTGGEKVTDHKWVIHEEIKDAGDALLEPGTAVVLQADHMEGMDGAEAVIDSAEQTVVYMVDYKAPNGEQVTNHKWVTESELIS